MNIPPISAVAAPSTHCCKCKATQSQTSSQPSSYVTIIKAWRHGETNSNKERLLSGGGPDDPLKKTVLNEKGKSQAEELGKLLVQSGKLDVIYTSDSSRAFETSNAVVNAFQKKGVTVKQHLSKQLREILHGKFELTDEKVRNDAGVALFNAILDADEKKQPSEQELKDRYRFCKVHPLVSNDEVVPNDIVNVDEYLKNKETRPETNDQLWKRVHQEFIRIARENPGATVGISTHGACLASLLEGLNPHPKYFYIPPHYLTKDIHRGDKVIIPAAVKVDNCALYHFKYDSRTGKLEIFDPTCN